MKLTIFASIITALLAASQVAALLPCNTDDDCSGLRCSGTKPRLCETAFCAAGVCRPPLCVARNSQCPVRKLFLDMYYTPAYHSLLVNSKSASSWMKGWFIGRVENNVHKSWIALYLEKLNGPSTSQSSFNKCQQDSEKATLTECG